MMLSLSSYVSHVVLLIPKPPVRTLPPRLAVVSAAKENNNVGALGRTILTAAEQNPSTAEISGSDVLWAVKKAAEKKTKRNKKARKSEELGSSAAGRREQFDDDGDDVRPLVVKSEWADKLAELEKRLGDLYESK